MGRAIKVLAVLALGAVLGVVAYAYLGDLTPPQATVTKPVALDGN